MSIRRSIPPTRTNSSASAATKVVIKPLGFLLWQTRERVGTPLEKPGLICFVDGKSTRARAGIVVHLTAPTIHTGWTGKITLEIVNLGPFDLVLQANDVIAQIIVARISSPPEKQWTKGSVTLGQTNVSGSNRKRAVPKKGPKPKR